LLTRDRLLAGLALLTLVGPLTGCSGSLFTGTAGDEGTVDLSQSIEAAKTNPNIAKAAARRGAMIEGNAVKRK